MPIIGVTIIAAWKYALIISTQPVLNNFQILKYLKPSTSLKSFKYAHSAKIAKIAIEIKTITIIVKIIAFNKSGDFISDENKGDKKYINIATNNLAGTRTTYKFNAVINIFFKLKLGKIAPLLLISQCKYTPI